MSAIHWTVGQAGSLAYLVIMCTAVAVTFQSIGQSRVSSSSASLILSLESVFGVLFSVIFLW
ncbi:EamA family transporter [Anaerostipes caccae]|uniref:EamA family transporter n=1 Tax=Anaerostipes caccae TaxID=105841 RepID=UPI0023E14727